MSKETQNRIAELQRQIRELQEELAKVKSKEPTVFVPEQFKEPFDEAEENVARYFSDMEINPGSAEIIINGERYVLLRSAAISHEFLDVFKEFYSNRPEEEAVRIGSNFLFDIAHVLGQEDAQAFHKKMGLEEPVAKLSAGPVHFAYTGWANVEILPESSPTPDNDYFIKYHHHNSFEAQAWIKAGRKSDMPVCIMNSGYSSGWCQQSFGIPLTAVEISCEAQGDDHCTFIMAPPDRIQEYLEQQETVKPSQEYDIPVFFERKYNEDQLKASLKAKETLLREVHHRVKNNLQIISSLLNLQQGSIEDSELKRAFTSSIMRVNTMAKIHEMIYGDRDLSSVDMQKYFSMLIRSLAQVYSADLDKVEIDLKVELDDLFLFPDKAIPLGLIVNEIATNSFKYAFNGEGRFYLRMTQKDENDYELVVGDNGPGLPDNGRKGSLGMSLIEILCDQIDAVLDVSSSEKGLEYKIQFKR